MLCSRHFTHIMVLRRLRKDFIKPFLNFMSALVYKEWR